MSGNVSEWRYARYDINYYKYCDTLGTNGTGGNIMINPAGPESPSSYNSYRVIRSGSWNNSDYESACTVSNRYPAYFKVSRIPGFRLALFP